MIVKAISTALTFALGTSCSIPFNVDPGIGPKGGVLHVESLFLRIIGATLTQTAGAITPIDGNCMASFISQIGVNCAAESPYAKTNPYGGSIIPLAAGLQVFNALMLMSGASLMPLDGGEVWDRAAVNQPTPYDVAGSQWSVSQTTNSGKLNHQGPFGFIGVGGTLVATSAAPWDINVPIGQLRNNEHGSNPMPVGWLTGNGGKGGCCNSGASGNLTFTMGSTATYGSAGVITLSVSNATAQVFAVMSEKPALEAPIRFHIDVSNFSAQDYPLAPGIHVATMFCEANASTGDDVISTMTSVTQIQILQDGQPCYGPEAELSNRWLLGFAKNAMDSKRFVAKWPSTERTTVGTSASKRNDTGFVPLIISGASLTQSPGSPLQGTKCPRLSVKLLNGTAVARTLVQCFVLPNDNEYVAEVAKYVGSSTDDVAPKTTGLAPSQLAANKHVLLPLVTRLPTHG